MKLPDKLENVTIDITDLFVRRMEFPKGWSVSISRLLFETATDINFFVGKAMNPAHQNSDIPMNFNLKMNLVEELSKCLRQMGKKVKVSYY